MAIKWLPNPRVNLKILYALIILLAAVGFFFSYEAYYGGRQVKEVYSVDPGNGRLFSLRPELKGDNVICYLMPPLLMPVCDANGKVNKSIQQQTICSTINGAIVSHVDEKVALYYNDTDTWAGVINFIVTYPNGSQRQGHIRPWYQVNYDVLCSDINQQSQEIEWNITGNNPTTKDR